MWLFSKIDYIVYIGISPLIYEIVYDFLLVINIYEVILILFE